MSIRCGIDLGTTFSAVAYYDAHSRRVETVDLEHADGGATIPSVVAFEPDGGVVVGKTALNMRKLHPERVIVGIKRSMGDDYLTDEIDGRRYSPQEVSAEILKVLKADAERHLGEPMSDVVISVPAYFGDAERLATREAAELAGLNVLELIAEPHAAALAFAIERAGDVENRNVLVYDLGGGTFDITLISTEREAVDGAAAGLRVTTLAKEGNRQLGGLDWDTGLARLVVDKAMEQDPDLDDPHDDARAEAVLLEGCETAKCDLSRGSSCLVLVGSSVQQVEVTRAELEAATGDLVLQTEALLEQVLEVAERDHGLLTERRIAELVAAGQEPAELEPKRVRLLLCGGGTRMPMVEACVTRVMGEQPLVYKNPSLLVSLGAAYRAYLLGAADGAEVGMQTIETRHGAVTLLEGGGDIGHPIGVEVVEVDDQGQVSGRRNVVLIRAGAAHGEIFEQEFGTAYAGMTEIPLVFYEGDAPDPGDCRRLADVRIEGLPPERPAGRPIKVRLWYDHDGIVCGQAIDQDTGTDVEIKIQRWTNAPADAGDTDD